MSVQAITRTARFPTAMGIPGYILAPNGGQIFYVDSGGVRDETTADVANMLFTTLAAALNACRANRGDTIIVLPQHTESVTATSHTWKAGVRVIGVGNGDERGTFTWDATGSTWAVSVPNVQIENVILNLGNANGVTAGITVTAAAFRLKGCDVVTTTDATHKATLGIDLGAGASRALIEGNNFRGAAGTLSTDVVKVSSTGDQIRIMDNVMVCGATAANGLIHVTGAATNFVISGNTCYSTGASSTAAIKIDDVASDGFIDSNRVAVTNNGTGANQGIVFAGTTTTTAKCGLNYSDDEAGKSGVLAPGAST